MDVDGVAMDDCRLFFVINDTGIFSGGTTGIYSDNVNKILEATGPHQIIYDITATAHEKWYALGGHFSNTSTE